MTVPNGQAAIPRKTTVAILGSGPAGLVLSRLLWKAGIDTVTIERQTRSYVENRQRAGILEQGTVDALHDCGGDFGMNKHGIPHNGIELLFNRQLHRVDFPELTGGRKVMVYAQTEVCRDLIHLQYDKGEGGLILWDTEALKVEGIETSQPRVHYRIHKRSQNAAASQAGPAVSSPTSADPDAIAPGDEVEDVVIEADYIVGCDGYWGVSRPAIPDGKSYERTYPFSWLGILADVAPVNDELIYARSDRGFALFSQRSHEVSRYYLQVPNGTDARTWSDDEIWAELERRIEIDDNDPASPSQSKTKLRRGKITQKSVTTMRSFVHEPMSHGRLFLAGDAAHIVPPTGAKGLNLAIGDVVILSRALIAQIQRNDPGPLSRYSSECIKRVWQAERFSYDMTNLLHVDPAASPFENRLQEARLQRIAENEAARKDLAMAYTGFPLES